MPVEQMLYTDARKLMQPGDVIAFGGKGHFSEIIKMATFSSVSHVGTILQTKIPEDDSGRFFNQIIESATIRGFSGVSVSRLSDRLDEYEGEIWWLPLSAELRQQRFKQKAFFDFLFKQAKEKKPYDMPQAIG
ncbi:MAG: hypothetical protein Q9N68_08890, partial [Gammaproteobacteria bacterium]|nr:hypothetical protein [Gammaproteobacteria bacterium]